MTGRAVTAQFMPSRPDLENQVIAQGKKEGRAWEQRRTVSWAISTLIEGDVYVADLYLKPYMGTMIGSNLGTGVYNRTKRGIIAYGHVRDMENLRKIKGFNGWIKGSDPSYMRKTLLTSINSPVRIGNAIVLPGDAVLAKKDGIVFIPAHLVEHIVLTGEVTALFDEFGEWCIREKKFSAGAIDSVWTDEIRNEFHKWAKNNIDKLPMSLDALNEYLEGRNF
jgi:regulator of RNase E activity RraA